MTRPSARQRPQRRIARAIGTLTAVALVASAFTAPASAKDRHRTVASQPHTDTFPTATSSFAGEFTGAIPDAPTGACHTTVGTRASSTSPSPAFPVRSPTSPSRST